MIKRTGQRTVYIGNYIFKTIRDVNIRVYDYEGKTSYSIYQVMLGNSLYCEANSLEEAKERAAEIINRKADSIVEDKLED